MEPLNEKHSCHVLHAPLCLVKLLRHGGDGPPQPIEQPRERCQRRQPKSSGSKETGDGEADGNGGGDKNRAEENEERGGEGEAD
ncbi:hypothetical protein F0562_004602 [Nyssa sinensis]|uniref:Uncharacterized protein n=1 Tax=Nyssa sinensis TaxID=561372 RepID=A0A5J5BYW1_9ASTE|nr:hypothetical protein F0562_004602 [Nyssa sinensis]